MTGATLRSMMDIQYRAAMRIFHSLPNFEDTPECSTVQIPCTISAVTRLKSIDADIFIKPEMPMVTQASQLQQALVTPPIAFPTE